jgi:hypothetical protein
LAESPSTNASVGWTLARSANGTAAEEVKASAR